LCSSMRWIVFFGIFGLPRNRATGFPASDTNTKLRNVDKSSTGML
jgi:hypothetical protein